MFHISSYLEANIRAPFLELLKTKNNRTEAKAFLLPWLGSQTKNFSINTYVTHQFAIENSLCRIWRPAVISTSVLAII